MGSRPEFLKAERRIVHYFTGAILIPTGHISMAPGEIPAQRLDPLIIGSIYLSPDIDSLQRLLQHLGNTLHGVVNLTFNLINDAATMNNIGIGTIKAK
jgi:hypothetical protein